MLPVAHRMRRAADFTDTTRGGRKATRGSVVVYARLGSRPVPPVIGLIVGKAVGGSVTRHRASRRIRAALAPLVSDLPVGSRIVVRALRGADADPNLAAQVAEALTRALEKAA